MESNKYYLPLESKNLAHYFAKACLCPVNYISNRNEDIQSLFPNHILLSNEKFVQDTNCSFEIILNTNEEEVIKISDNFFLFEKPLPITRVKKINFKSETQKTQTVFDVTSGAAFLPEKLIEVDSVTESINTYQIKNIIKVSDINWNDNLDLFNRILGGFSIMGISGIENSYPTDYFHALSIFNTLVREELVNQSVPIHNNYEWALIKGGKFVELYETIHSRIDLNAINHFALKESISLTRNNGKIVTDKIKKNSNTYNITTLGSYGEGTRMSVDNFISDLVSDKFPLEKKEGLSLMFGINQGYEIFRNKYKTQNFEIDIKFRLNSQLDYFTIESIYQFVFNGKTDNNSFKYLLWCPEFKEIRDFKNYETFDVLDRTFVIKKKETEKEAYFHSFQSLFQSIPKEVIYEKIIADYVKLLPSFTKITSNEEAIKYFASILEDNLKDYGYTFFLKGTQEKLYSEQKDIEIKNKELIRELENTVKIQKDKIRELESKLNESIKTYPNDKDDIVLKSEVSESGTAKTYSNDKNDIVLKSKISESENFNNSEPVLIPIDNEEEYNFNKRKKELKNLGITKLKSLAKGIGVKNVNEFNKESTEKLVDLILNIEFKRN